MSCTMSRRGSDNNPMLEILAEEGKGDKMNLITRVWRFVRAKQVIGGAITGSTLLLLPACDIPPLQHAEPGPPLPATFPISYQLSTASDESSEDDTKDSEESPKEEKTILQTAFLDEEKDADGTTQKAPKKPEKTPNESDSTPLNAPTVVESSALPGGVCPESSARVGVDQFFNDPHLLGLIHQALHGNQELKILAQEIQIANNEILARRGEYLPFVTIGGGAGFEKSSLYTPRGAVEDQLEVLPGKDFPDPLPDFLVAAKLSWQVDIWRQLRNARDVASLRFLASIEGRNYIVTRLVAEVAENYYTLLALDNQLVVLDQTIALQQKSLEIAIAKKEAARGTELAVQRFRAEVRKNQSEKLIVKQEIIEAENRINFLVGRFPQPVERKTPNFLDLNLHALSVGVPAKLLQNRPDIRQAERELEAAGLNIEVARANFYPRLDITAGIGYQAFNPRYLFNTPEALIANLAGDLVAPLINKAAIKAEYLTANAKQLQAIYQYQRIVLDAFTEVVNRVSKVENFRKSIEVKRQQLKALEISVESASALFQNARAEYIEVLFAQRDLLEARTVLIDTKREQLAAIVNAYQALGGGDLMSQLPLGPLCNPPALSIPTTTEQGPALEEPREPEQKKPIPEEKEKLDPESDLLPPPRVFRPDPEELGK